MLTEQGSSSLAERLQDVVRSVLEQAGTSGRDQVAADLRERHLLPTDLNHLAEPEATQKFNDVIQIALNHGMASVLALHRIPFPRYPFHSEQRQGPPVWDIASEVARPTGWKLLGFDVGFPIGVPASELTSTPDWIEYYARQGFNILTFRTVRTRVRESEGNWGFVQIPRPWGPDDVPPDAVDAAESELPPDWNTISTVTPFAAPSVAPDTWKGQIRESLSRIAEHQILIVSVMDSVPWDKKTDQALIDDFVDVATTAQDAGAHAIECHLARSRRKGPDGELRSCDLSPPTAFSIVSAVRSALGPSTPLLVKLSSRLSRPELEALVVPLAEANLLDGVSGISPARVQLRAVPGAAADRPPGVAGWAIRDLGFRFVEDLAAIRLERALDFDIVAMGGVMNADDVAHYLRLGADAVQSASAARCNPGLAAAATASVGGGVEGMLLRAIPERAERAKFYEKLEGALTPKQARIWLASMNSFLAGSRPYEALAQGRLDEVKGALDAFVAGVYA